MNYLEVIILGAVQGITEFFPISSSGHLIFARKIFSFSEFPLLLEVALHFGTLLSILFYWTKRYSVEFKKLISGELSTALNIIIGCIPVALVGLFFKEKIELNFFNINSTEYLISAYFFMSVLLFISKYFSNNKIEKISYLNALVIGISQAFAIIPGISRSGITIVVALLLGITFRKALEFSFMLVVPILFFSSLVSFISEYKLISTDFNILLFLIVGIFSSAISGYYFLSVLEKIITKINSGIFLFTVF